MTLICMTEKTVPGNQPPPHNHAHTLENAMDVAPPSAPVRLMDKSCSAG